MASTQRPLVQFKAGRCDREGTTNKVVPDPTKGLVYMKEEDGLMHFYWKNRTSNSVEDDLILFPGDAELKMVPECTTGRVVVLQFKSSSQKLFFWLQDASTSKDQTIVQQVNALINQDDSGQSMDEDVNME